MKLTELTIKLLFLFIPGIISLIIFRRLVTVRKYTPFYFVTYSFVLGVFSYSVLSVIRGFFSNEKDYNNTQFINSIFSPNFHVSPIEILSASCVSVIISFFLAAIVNYSILNRIGKFLKVSKKFGNDDVWGFLHSHHHDDSIWVIIRDLENNLAFYGWVYAYSESYKNNELILRDVVVYNNDSWSILYEIPGIYLTRPHDSLTIELASFEKGVQNGK